MGSAEYAKSARNLLIKIPIFEVEKCHYKSTVVRFDSISSRTTQEFNYRFPLQIDGSHMTQLVFVQHKSLMIGFQHLVAGHNRIGAKN